MQSYKNMSIGSIVTANGFRSGYWRIVDITDRSGPTHHYPEPILGHIHPEPLVKIVQVCDAKGKFPKKGRTEVCDIGYCALITRDRVEKTYADAVEAADEIRRSVSSLMNYWL
jgi:hypothetical protein